MSDDNNFDTWVTETWSPNRFNKASEEAQSGTFTEQIRGLYQLTHYGVATTIVIAALVASVLVVHDSAAMGLGWMAAVSLVAVGRFLLSRQFFHINPPVSELRRWAGLSAVATGLQGSTWAALVALSVHSPESSDFAMAVFVASGFAFGGLATLGSYMPAYLTFSLPIFAATFVAFLLVPTPVGWLVTVVIVVFSLTMISAVFSASRTLRSSLLARHENRELIRTLSEESERVQVTLRSIGDGVITADTEERVTYLNPMAEALTGWTDEEAKGRALSEVLTLIHETTRDALPDLGRTCLDRGQTVVPEGECCLLDRYGKREFSVEVSVAPIRDDAREVIGIVVVVHDVTELRRMARIMAHQANHDPLTGLVNRREFEHRLSNALATSASDHSRHVMFYLDLDQFKVVNDTCGHVAGDELLKQLSGLLRNEIRESDTLARLGGDEFGVLLSGCALDKARTIAEELCELVRNFRFTWEDKIFNVGVSIGVAALEGARTPTDVLSAADSACYVAKDEGRNRVHIFDPEDGEVLSRHGEMQLTAQIGRALDEDRFELRYQRIQPLHPEAGGEHAEILLTMIDPDGKTLSPGMFLPAAERYSMMSSVDRWVVRRAFQQLAGGARLLQDVETLAINLSGQSLSNEHFLDFVNQELERSGVDPNRICFEITETAVIANLGRAKDFIRVLRERGCRFSLDDFGSGLSSFGYLRSLPVDYLKIDGTFVRNMTGDAIDRAMVESINQVGHVMHIRTIAEFVEDAATLEALREIGVDYAQGYHIHRPETLV